jgi:hypothetical protein
MYIHVHIHMYMHTCKPFFFKVFWRVCQCPIMGHTLWVWVCVHLYLHLDVFVYVCVCANLLLYITKLGISYN